MKRFLMMAALWLALPAMALAGEYDVDVVHSSVTFKVRHFFSKVSGSFSKFNVKLDYDKANPANSKVSAEIEVDSVDTNNAKRDAHLKNKDFFETSKHPKLTFTSKKVTVISKEKLQVEGDLTMRGVTKSVTLDVTINGIGKDFKGKERIGFSASTKVNRHDFKISYGKGVVGADVEIALEISAVGK
jgi:polyisoprenoid-binding protein YceI